MRIMRYHPIDLLDWNKFFQEISTTNSISYPPNTIRELDDGHLLEFALAGWKREDITINVDQNILTINGNMQEIEREGKLISNTMAFRSFEIHKKLNDVHDASNISAVLGHGILTIKIPFDKKKITKKEIKIEINENDQ